MKLIIFIVVDIILFRSCNASLCEIDVAAPIDLSPLDIADIVSFIQSQYVTPQLIGNVVTTELQNLKDISDYQAGSNNEDMNLNITELVHKYGYEIEDHEVETDDGYILTMQRIPGSGSVVYLQHGLFSSADDWVTAGPITGLPYILASKGYDVWLGNARGNKYSEKHVTLSPDCAEFWNYSWDEIGRYDLPAMIDYVLNSTGKPKLTYIGHSQGTTSYFVMCSELPEYNEKISLMVALSPVAWMSHLKSPFVRAFALGTGVAYTLLEAIGLNKLFSNSVLNSALTSVICGDSALGAFFCSNIVGILYGFDRGQCNVTNLPVLFAHFPSASSTKQLAHYGQEIESANFCRFDYGSSVNQEVYNSSSPPNYPVEKITAPMAMYYSNGDWFSNITDVTILHDKLKNVVKFQLVEDYNHQDFLWAKNVKELVFDSVLDLIKQYS